MTIPADENLEYDILKKMIGYIDDGNDLVARVDLLKVAK